MARRFVWKIAAPMIGLGIVLLLLGTFAAYNVHQQQQVSAELSAHQANSMLAIHELNIVMREIRWRLIGFLRTHDLQHLRAIVELHATAGPLLQRAGYLAREGRERTRIEMVEAGDREFFDQFQQVFGALSAEHANEPTPTANDAQTIAISPEQTAVLNYLASEVLSNRVLRPLEESLTDNKHFVEETNEANQATAQQLKTGFLLLGICGAVAGLLLGTAIARTIGRSLVQLDVTVRGVAGRLSDITGPVTISHTGGLAEINSGLRELERDIANVLQRLHQRETELLRSEQLANLGQLAAGMAHELRNPLMPMKMLVQSALERRSGEGLKGRSLEVIAEEISRLEEAIRRFLEYARPPLPEKSAQDIRELVTSTLELVSGRARQQGVTIVSTLADEALIAEVDRGQLRQLLLNLLLNALDAQPDGGQIHCVVASGDASFVDSRSLLVAAAANATAETPGEIGSLASHPPSSQCDRANTLAWLSVRVADRGPGISPDVLEQVFEPFVTTKETGTGLGLSVCRRIASAHEGTLTARNSASGGAEFLLVLPRQSFHS